MAKIGLFPGAFKPPHKGHLMVVEDLLLQCDEVIILISPKDREQITSINSVTVWQLYLQDFDPNKVKLWVVPENAVTEAYNYLSKYPEHDFVLAFGKDDEKRFNAAQDKSRYPNAEVFNAGNNLNLSATNFRKALRERNVDIVNMYLPDGINCLTLFEKLRMNIHETFSKDWWKEELKETLGENLQLSDQEIIEEFIQFTCNQLYMSTSDVNYELVDTPIAGGTYGTFDPNTGKIVVFYGDRKLPDMLRTLAHELHHKYQSLNNIELDGTTGSPCENEANSMAGILLRKYKEIRPEIFRM